MVILTWANATGIRVYMYVLMCVWALWYVYVLVCVGLVVCVYVLVCVCVLVCYK